MAGTDEGDLKIVRRYSVPNAPTGESQRVVTEDGRHWKPTFSNERPTGRVLAEKSGNSIRIRS